MIKEIHEFISACPCFEGVSPSLNHLGSHVGDFSLESTGAARLLKEYTDGGRLYGLGFVLAMRGANTASVSGNCRHLDRMEEFCRWLKACTPPKLTGNLVAVTINVPGGIEVKKVSDLTARYETGFELIYYEKPLC